jgi:twitching motility protein PilT
MAMAHVDELLTILLSQKGSDLHLRSGLAPFMRTHGEMKPLPDQPVQSREHCLALIMEIMPEPNRLIFKKEWDTDFAYEMKGVGRFRVNVFEDRQGIGAVMRTIPVKPLTADQLNLPAVVREFCYLKKGLVVVTGPTGSGKSTTLAAMIDLINKTRADHIITIEDPIEFIHIPQKCVVTQRDVPQQTRSYSSALRAALREDPDVVLVGDLRDPETLERALETAEAGQLVFGALRTTTAIATVDRMIDMFPPAKHNQIRAMLANTLKGVLAQSLCKRADGNGRVAAMEVLVVTAGIAAKIRDGKTSQILSAMQAGRGIGMQAYDESLFDLVKSGAITIDEAYSEALEKESLTKKIATLGVRYETRNQAADAHKGADPMERRQGIINMYLETLQKEPDNADVLNNLAWLLATADNLDAVSIENALAMALKANALTSGQHPGVLDTLGAALAQNGQFDKALDAARKGLKLARANQQNELAAALERRIELYESGKPVRE